MEWLFCGCREEKLDFVLKCIYHKAHLIQIIIKAVHVLVQKKYWPLLPPSARYPNNATRFPSIYDSITHRRLFVIIWRSTLFTRGSFRSAYHLCVVCKVSQSSCVHYSRLCTLFELVSLPDVSHSVRKHLFRIICYGLDNNGRTTHLDRGIQLRYRTKHTDTHRIHTLNVRYTLTDRLGIRIYRRIRRTKREEHEWRPRGT